MNLQLVSDYFLYLQNLQRLERTRQGGPWITEGLRDGKETQGILVKKINRVLTQSFNKLTKINRIGLD